MGEKLYDPQRSGLDLFGLAHSLGEFRLWNLKGMDNNQARKCFDLGSTACTVAVGEEEKEEEESYKSDIKCHLNIWVLTHI